MFSKLTKIALLDLQDKHTVINCCFCATAIDYEDWLESNTCSHKAHMSCGMKNLKASGGFCRVDKCRLDWFANKDDFISMINVMEKEESTLFDWNRTIPKSLESEIQMPNLNNHINDYKQATSQKINNEQNTISNSEQQSTSINPLQAQAQTQDEELQTLIQ
jgi:DNA-binding transcriptional regulator GbsR (MarR family)